MSRSRSRSRTRGRRRQPASAFDRAFSHRRRGTRGLVALATLIALLVAIAAQRTGWLAAYDDQAVGAFERYHGRVARVERIIDGDTLDVAISDPLTPNAATTRIRLWGIDCPEHALFGRAQQPWAREATAFAESVALGRMVRLMLEAHRPRDSFDRVLAHIELPDGRSLNLLLVEAGLARADDRWPHAHLSRYAQAEVAARQAQRGMWQPAETSRP